VKAETMGSAIPAIAGE